MDTEPDIQPRQMEGITDVPHECSTNPISSQDQQSTKQHQQAPVAEVVEDMQPTPQPQGSMEQVMLTSTVSEVMNGISSHKDRPLRADALPFVPASKPPPQQELPAQHQRLDMLVSSARALFDGVDTEDEPTNSSLLQIVPASTQHRSGSHVSASRLSQVSYHGKIQNG